MKQILVLVILVFLSACGGSSSSTSAFSSSGSSGFISGAPIDNATCVLYAVESGVADKDTTLATSISSQGVINFSSGYQGIALIECTSGNYTDEATGNPKTSPVLRSVVNYASTSTYAVSPLTEISYQMGTNTLDVVLATHSMTVAKAFGLTGIAINTVRPTNIDDTNIANTNNGHYASILAGFSQLESNASMTMSAMMSSFKDELLANARLSNNTNTSLVNALTMIESASHTNTRNRLHTDVLATLRASINNNNILAKKLNDTGIIWGGNYSSGNNSTCTSNVTTPQDCHQGRDTSLTLAISTFTYNATGVVVPKVGAGSAGFDFTKLSSTGSVLAIQNAAWSATGSETLGTQWSCVKDNVTGLIWEVKTDDNSIHDKDNTYRWGGLTAIGATHTNKEGTYYSDWTGLVTGTNSESLCGFTNWQVPNIDQLASIVHYGRINPSIDTNYFPNTTASYFWSASPNAYYSDLHGNSSSTTAMITATIAAIVIGCGWLLCESEFYFFHTILSLMQYHNRFPIYRDATALVVEIENIVKQFPKYHKYTLGSEMRKTAYDLLIAITYSINNINARKQSVKKAHNLSEVLKIKIHLAKNITNISFKLFEILVNLVMVVSKQCKAWQKQLQRQRQNEVSNV